MSSQLVAAGPVVDEHLGRCRRCGTLEPFFSLAKAFLPSLARLQHRAQAAWAQLSRQYGTLQCEKGVWLILQLYGACMLPAGSFGCELWGVWLLRGQFRKTRDHLSTLYHGHLSSLSGVRRTVPTSILLEELGQQPLADMWLLRATGFWNSLMTGSAFHKAMAQDAVQLLQITGTKGWVAGLSKALQTAGWAFQPQQLQSIDIGQLQSLLRGGRERTWDDLDVCPRTAPSQGARKCTYAQWFRKPSRPGAFLLTLPLAHAAMQRLLGLRTGCHGLSWITKGHWQPIWRAWHLVSAMRCTWSLSAQQWQICVANLQIFFRHIRLCSNSCGSQICCRLPNS